MLSFIGQYPVTIDKSGRFKLPAKAINDFRSEETEDLVVYCLPEGCLGIYQANTWEEMRSMDRFLSGNNLSKRREMRRFGALTATVQITKQGRITIPPLLRELANLQEQQAILVGSEVGMELWSSKRWAEELAIINKLDDENDTIEQE